MEKPLPCLLYTSLSCRNLNNGRVVISFFGDGAVNNGAFHESLNMAGVFKLPVLFICENNIYANSTNMSKTTAGEKIGDKSKSYDIPGYIIDGSDVLGVFSTVREAAENARNGKGPSLIEAKTYRFYGHHSNDQCLYRSKEEEEMFKSKKDPIINFKKQLINESLISELEITKIEKEAERKVKDAILFAESGPESDLESFLDDIKEFN